MHKTTLINRKVWGWAFYDFANSAYVLIFLSYTFPLLFREVSYSGGETADFYWGLALGLGVLSGVIAAPFVGSLKDKARPRLLFLLVIILAACGMLSLGFIPYHSPSVVFLVFIITHGMFTVSLMLYDSFLPDLFDIKTRAEVSGFAWGFGYIGGIVCLVLVLVWNRLFPAVPQGGLALTAVFFAVFATLSAVAISKAVINKNSPKHLPSVNDHPLSTQLWDMFRERLPLLLGLWLVNDVIITITFFAALFGRYTLELSVTTIGAFLLGLQILAFPLTWLAGKLGRAWGEKRVILLSIGLWLLIILALVIASSIVHYALIVFATAFVIGSTQSMLRSYYSRTLTTENSGVGFSLYAIASRTSSVIGPLIFGAISSGLSSQRLAMLVMIVPLLIGGFLIARYPIQYERSN